MNMNGNNGASPLNNGVGGPFNPQNNGSGPSTNPTTNLQGTSLGSLENLNSSSSSMGMEQIVPPMEGMNQSDHLTMDMNSFNASMNANLQSQPLESNSMNSLNSMNASSQSVNNTLNTSGDAFGKAPLASNTPNNGTMSMNPTPDVSMQSQSLEPNPTSMVNNGAMNGIPNIPIGNDMNANQTPNFFVPNSGEPSNNNIFESVPTPPSINDFNHLPSGKKSKKKMSKTTIILLVILLICLIGAGVYFVLTSTKNSQSKGSINLISDPLVWELGKDLTSDVSDYANITGFDKSTCKVDTSKVDSTKMGSYDITVICGAISKSGKIVLQDKVAPVVTVREVNVVPGTKVQIEDFIVSCVDSSNCSYALENSSVTLDQMTATEGNYQFNLIVSDDYNNSTTVSLTLIVSNNAPVKYMRCTPTETEENDINAILSISYNYGINNDNVLVSTEKNYTYTFDVKEDYLKVKNTYDAATGIQGIIGVTSFDDDEFVITITTSLTEGELAKEFNVSSFSTNYDDLKQFNLDQGISCKNR